jgi:vancomycin permeability regulator SanA
MTKGAASPTKARPTGGTNKRRRLRLRWPRLRTLLVLTLVGLFVGLGPYTLLRTSTAAARHRQAAEVPTAPVAVVLGAGVDGNLQPSWALARRIDSAVELYKLGKVRALLMSGDNSRWGYDEPAAMRDAAVKQGVPSSAVVLDYAGFDTYSTCYRARHAFGLTRITLVSQDFHLARAIWICQRLGVAAEGLAAADADGPTTAGWKQREVAASVLAVLDVVRGRRPVFPGPREHSLDGLLAG